MGTVFNFEHDSESTALTVTANFRQMSGNMVMPQSDSDKNDTVFV